MDADGQSAEMPPLEGFFSAIVILMDGAYVCLHIRSNKILSISGI